MNLWLRKYLLQVICWQFTSCDISRELHASPNTFSGFAHKERPIAVHIPPLLGVVWRELFQRVGGGGRASPRAKKSPRKGRAEDRWPFHLKTVFGVLQETLEIVWTFAAS